ncbi:hypothetical protein ABW21_db0209647 [Orbilia brochopaga]|nr:hypothetical protein ABW21_db0209647 [Drechslerella brochopaga]
MAGDNDATIGTFAKTRSEEAGGDEGGSEMPVKDQKALKENRDSTPHLAKSKPSSSSLKIAKKQGSESERLKRLRRISPPPPPSDALPPGAQERNPLILGREILSEDDDLQRLLENEPEPESSGRFSESSTNAGLSTPSSYPSQSDPSDKSPAPPHHKFDFNPKYPRFDAAVSSRALSPSPVGFIEPASLRAAAAPRLPPILKPTPLPRKRDRFIPESVRRFFRRTVKRPTQAILRTRSKVKFNTANPLYKYSPSEPIIKTTVLPNPPQVKKSFDPIIIAPRPLSVHPTGLRVLEDPDFSSISDESIAALYQNRLKAVNQGPLHGGPKKSLQKYSSLLSDVPEHLGGHRSGYQTKTSLRPTILEKTEPKSDPIALATPPASEPDLASLVLTEREIQQLTASESTTTNLRDSGDKSAIESGHDVCKTSLQQIVSASILLITCRAETKTNPRGIPEAPFIENVEDFVTSKQEIEPAIRKFSEMIAKYTYMMESNARRAAGLKEKIPDIKKTLQMVQFLDNRNKKGDEEPISTMFELSDTLYAKASVIAPSEVYLWLGANVMLAYPNDEAIAMLKQKFSAAQESLRNCEEDIDFLRQQITRQTSRPNYADDTDINPLNIPAEEHGGGLGSVTPTRSNTAPMIGRHHAILRKRLVVGGPVSGWPRPGAIRYLPNRRALSTVNPSPPENTESTTTESNSAEGNVHQEPSSTVEAAAQDGAKVEESPAVESQKTEQPEQLGFKIRMELTGTPYVSGHRWKERQIKLDQWKTRKLDAGIAQEAGTGLPSNVQSIEKPPATDTDADEAAEKKTSAFKIFRYRPPNTIAEDAHAELPQFTASDKNPAKLAKAKFRLFRPPSAREAEKGPTITHRPLKSGLYEMIDDLDEPGEIQRYGYNSNTGKLVDRSGVGEAQNLKELVGTYWSSRTPVRRWQPDEIDHRNQGAELLERADRAVPLIDQALRQKLISRFQGVPREEPKEEVDVQQIATAFTELRIPSQYTGSDIDIESISHKFPDEMSDQIRRADQFGLSLKLEIPDAVITSLTPDEWVTLLRRMRSDSVVANGEKLVQTLERKQLQMTKELGEALVVPLAYVGSVNMVRRIMKLCHQAGININSSHLLRAYRSACRKDDSLVAELDSVIIEVAKTGFDELAYGHLMQIYADSGRLDLVVALFNNHENFVVNKPLKSAHVHNSLLYAFRNSAMAEEAEYVYLAMKHGMEGAPKPNPETYGFLAQIYERRPDYYGKLLLLVKEYLETGMEFSDELFGALMKACASAGRIDATLAVFDKMMSKPELRPTRDLIRDYLSAILQAQVDPSDEKAVSIGLPVYDKLPVNIMDALELDQGLSSIRDGEGPDSVPTEIKSEEDTTAVPEAAQLDPKHEKYQIPMPPVPPTTAGELLAIVDLQYQHLRKYQPKIVTLHTQRLFLRTLVVHGFYETFKKAYRYLALATGFRGKKSLFPEYQAKTKITFADFAKGADLDTTIDPDERFEFDYLQFPLSPLEIFPALRSAFETKDLDFVRVAIADYERLQRDFPEALAVRPKVRQAWGLMAEAMMINALAHCGDIAGAYQRFEQTMQATTWDIDSPRLFSKRIGVFTGVLVQRGMDEMAARVFRMLQATEWEVQEAYNRHSRLRKINLERQRMGIA